MENQNNTNSTANTDNNTKMVQENNTNTIENNTNGFFIRQPTDEEKYEFLVGMIQSIEQYVQNGPTPHHK